MGSSLFVWALICLLSGGAAPPVGGQAKGQAPGQSAKERSTLPDPSIIKRLISAGGFDEARHLLSDAPPTREYQGLRFDLERAARDVNAALAAWEGLARAGTTDWERLRGLAVDVAAGLRRHDEPIVRVQACGVLLRAGQRECADDLRPAVRDVSLPWNLRLLAAKELVSSGAPRATQELSEIASEAVASDPSSALTAMSDADPMAAIATFAAALQGTQNPQTQYQAAYLLGDAGTRSKAAAAKAKETLDGFLAAKPRGPAQTAAVISLARVGGPDQVTELRQVFGTLGGYDKLMAAVALAERGDRTAASSIRSIAATLSEQLQLEAAVRMAPWDRDAAVAMLSTQTRSASPVARLAALQTWPHLKAAPPLAVRTALGDVDPTIRAAAAVAVTSPFAPAGPERRQ